MTYNAQSQINAYGFPTPYTRLFPAPIIAQRAPLTTDVKFPLGQIWIYQPGDEAYILVADASGTATWEPFAGSAAVVETLTGDSGGPISPTAGNINVLGTANEITTTGSGSTITWSIPSTFIAPGTIASTTTLHSGTSMSAATTITATLGNITATNGNIVLGTIGHKFIVPTGTNASAGTSGGMSGSPGAITVATTASSTTAKVFYCRDVTGGTPGEVSITAQDGTGFTLTSTGNETSTFNWWIINA